MQRAPKISSHHRGRFTVGRTKQQAVRRLRLGELIRPRRMWSRGAPYAQHATTTCNAPVASAMPAAATSCSSLAAQVATGERAGGWLEAAQVVIHETRRPCVALPRPPQCPRPRDAGGGMR
eukprot:scaffold30948_cov112-Isochrysis_galbana.AAC.2